MQTLLLALWASALPNPSGSLTSVGSTLPVASAAAPRPSLLNITPRAAEFALAGAAWPGQDSLDEPTWSGASRPGWYLSLYGGLGQLQDGAFDQVSGSTTNPADGSYDSGFLTGFSVGRRFDANWSAELDYTYRTNDISGIDLAGGGSLAGSGDFASVAILANLRYDFMEGKRWRPYAGLGLGILQEVDADLQPGNVEASERGTLAFQLMAGASYQVDRNWSLFAEARYLGTGGADLEDEATGDVYAADYDSLGLLLGVRYGF
jgi:opacity protein-like surface antigen